MVFKEITVDDIPAIINLRGKTRENPYSIEDLKKIGITPDSLKRDLKEDLAGFLCEVDTKIAGFAMGNKSNCEILVIAILPEFENMGIGRKLLKLVENWLYENGCNNLWLTTGNDPNKRAYGFYKNLGWTPSEIKNNLRYMRKKRDI